MNKSTIFKKAHELAKKVHINGECYKVTFSTALRIVFKESKTNNTLKSKVSVVRYNGNLLVKVPFDIKDDFKSVVKGVKWMKETKEWFIPASSIVSFNSWRG